MPKTEPNRRPTILETAQFVGEFMQKESPQHKAMRRIAAKLAELKIPYAICGGMALGPHGYMRATEDVDVLITEEGLKLFKQECIGAGWVNKFEGSTGVKDVENKVPIDFLQAGKLAGYSKDYRFPSPAELELHESDDIRFLGIATLIEFKLVAGITSASRLRDLGDAQELIKALHLPDAFSEYLTPMVREKYHELWVGAQELPNDDF